LSRTSDWEWRRFDEHHGSPLCLHRRTLVEALKRAGYAGSVEAGHGAMADVYSRYDYALIELPRALVG